MPIGVVELTGAFCQSSFELHGRTDSYLDMSRYKEGHVWVNGQNLGPQQWLYCSAPWLQRGANEIMVLDLHPVEPTPINDKLTLSN